MATLFYKVTLGPVSWLRLIKNTTNNYRLLSITMKKMTNRCFLRCPVWEQSTHHFPNHKKNHDRFKAWVEAIDRKLETDEDYEYFRTKRLCHIHFIPMYCYNNRRLSPLAIPTLYLTKESRDEYWSKDLELRKSMLQSAQDEMPMVKAESPKDDTESPKDKAGTNNEEPVMVVPVEKLLLNDAQSSLRSDVQESLVNLLIADIIEGENENYTQDVQEQSMLELSVPSPVESNVLNPVADIIIEYVSTTETSGQKLSMRQIPRDITTCAVLENFPREPVFIQDTHIGSTLLETYAEEIEINFDSVQNCTKRPRKKYKSKYNGLSWELPLRIPMEHNYSKASIVSPTSHISSNGLHPRQTIRTLKSQVKELRQELKFYKQKYKDLLRMNQETAPKKIKSKKITKLSQKGPASRKKAYKNVITYIRL